MDANNERLQRKLKFAKPKKKIVAKKKLGVSKIKYAETTPDSFDSPLRNVLLGDILGTGIIGGLDMNISTPL